ncbi:SAM-dependent methyltransferase, partial [Halomonas sp. ND22Bw]
KWATRALIEEVLGGEKFDRLSCWEPTCGRGYMASTLAEYFRTVRSSDVHGYGYGEIFDFLSLSAEAAAPHDRPDWIVTNPPFRLGEEFVRRALQLARSGVAMLVRTGFIEGAGRYERLFKDRPPSCVAQFVERVPILRGRVDPRASTATGYCWLI